jgi:hypothetical protein
VLIKGAARYLYCTKSLVPRCYAFGPITLSNEVGHRFPDAIASILSQALIVSSLLIAFMLNHSFQIVRAKSTYLKDIMLG